jgi:hypothetical protein
MSFKILYGCTLLLLICMVTGLAGHHAGVNLVLLTIVLLTGLIAHSINTAAKSRKV